MKLITHLLCDLLSLCLWWSALALQHKDCRLISAEHERLNPLLLQKQTTVLRSSLSQNNRAQRRILPHCHCSAWVAGYHLCPSVLIYTDVAKLGGLWWHKSRNLASAACISLFAFLPKQTHISPSIKKPWAQLIHQFAQIVNGSDSSFPHTGSLQLGQE